MAGHNRRDVIRTLAAAPAGLSLARGAPVRAASARRPNILFIMADNLGYGELGCYGGGATRGAPTRRIDRLAAEGLRLTNMNMETQCTPSRSSMMTGRFAIRSGTYAVPFGGVPEGLTTWEVTLGNVLSDAGYRTALFGKWHLGSSEQRLPNNRGFDEWFGIPRTSDEAMWVGSPGYDPEVMPPEPILEGLRGGKNRAVGTYDLVQRRLIDGEVTRRTIGFLERMRGSPQPFLACAFFTQPHLPTLANPKFSGRTGNGDWADMLAEMDDSVGQILDSLDRLGMAEDTLVIFTSDNGGEFLKPWDGWSGPWRGQYFTALEGGIRVPMILRWPGRIGAGGVSNEIVHGADLFTTLASLGGGAIPTDRPIDGVDQSAFLLGRSEKSAREGFPIWCSNRLQAVKWRNYKVHFYKQDTMRSPAEKRDIPLLVNLFTNPQEDENELSLESWVIGPALKIVRAFEASAARYPLIPMGTPDPYQPPARS